MLKQICVHNARMHHIHLHMRLLRIQHALQVPCEQNLCQLGLTVGGARVIVLAANEGGRKDLQMN